MPDPRKARIVEHARLLGFDLVGVASAEPFDREAAIFQERVAAGYLAGWRYTSEMIRDFCTPSRSLPGAKSIVCTATAYFSDDEAHDPNAPGLRGAVSRYAWGADYHRTVGKRMRRLADFIRGEFPGTDCLACVDTGPLVDRAAAVRSGIGWFGKSGNVLTREFGSWVFLAELITTLELEPDVPLQKNCGECAVCIERCPTSAIGADGAIDARRCISDLTQSKRPIPREFRKFIGNRIWGCDDCQTVCPVNHRKEGAVSPGGEEFRPLAHIGTSVDLPSVLRMTKAQFRRWFGPTAMAWRGKAVLQRNAAVALGNSRDVRAVPHLVAALRDRKPLVRGHAAWALGELGGEEARSALDGLLASERDSWVREEAGLALQKVAGPATGLSP